METHKCFKLFLEMKPSHVVQKIQTGCEDNDDDPRSGQLSNAQNPQIVVKVSETVAKNHQITLILMVEQLCLGGDSSWQRGKKEDIHQVFFNHSPG